MPLLFSRVAIVGTGLIGGSLALAVRSALGGARIIGWDQPEVMARATARSVVDECRPGLAEAVAGADLIFVALPVALTIERLPEIARYAAPGALVTDAASTKRTVCAAADACFGPLGEKGALFLGGHPMAGNEGSGLDAADRTLFRGAKYALIKPSGSVHFGGSTSGDEPRTDARLDKFVQLLQAVGARPMWMDAATHDRAAAVVSHLPQLLAVALAGVARDASDQTGLPLALAGPGLRDALRLAGSPYSLWRDIILTNTDNLDAALDRLAQAIEHLRTNLRQRELESEFAAANEVYKILRNLQ